MHNRPPLLENHFIAKSVNIILKLNHHISNIGSSSLSILQYLLSKSANPVSKIAKPGSKSAKVAKLPNFW